MESLKAKWINALRSGKYKQATGALRNCYGHCCLGVLIDNHPEFRIGGIGKTVTAVNKKTGDIFNGLNTYIPERIVWPEAQEALVLMNDVEGKSFDEIADYIETHASEDLKTWKI